MSLKSKITVMVLAAGMYATISPSPSAAQNFIDCPCYFPGSGGSNTRIFATSPNGCISKCMQGRDMGGVIDDWGRLEGWIAEYRNPLNRDVPPDPQGSGGGFGGSYGYGGINGAVAGAMVGWFCSQYYC